MIMLQLQRLHSAEKGMETITNGMKYFSQNSWTQMRFQCDPSQIQVWNVTTTEICTDVPC
jgi:hypothetical protein